jgi:broad specificity phosphatase PhoE
MRRLWTPGSRCFRSECGWWGWDNKMRLILIRHGASAHSIIGGSSCPGLTDEGFKQANLLAARFRTGPEVSDCHTLLSSPVLRAHQTADVLARMLEILPIVQDDDLTEIRPGEAEGLSWDAYRSQYGKFDFVAEPTRPFAPGGESWLQYLDRVRTTLQRLAETYTGQTVLAVTHAGFIVASVLVVFDIPRPGTQAGKHPSMRGWLEPLHTSLTEWNATPERWTLARYNDTSHIASG